MDEKRFKEWPNVTCWYDVQYFKYLGQTGRILHSFTSCPVGNVMPVSFRSWQTCWGGANSILFHRTFEAPQEPLGGFKSDGLFDRKVFFEAEFHNGNVLGNAELL